MPKTAEPWSLTSLREKLIKIGAKVVSHGRYVTFPAVTGCPIPKRMLVLPEFALSLPRGAGAVDATTAVRLRRGQGLPDERSQGLAGMTINAAGVT